MRSFLHNRLSIPGRDAEDAENAEETADMGSPLGREVKVHVLRRALRAAPAARPRRGKAAWLRTACWLLALAATGPRAAAGDLGQETRRVLSEKCFACHGPDARARKAGLRLDTREGAFGELPRGG